jgi:hypothetical protein
MKEEIYTFIGQTELPTIQNGQIKYWKDIRLPEPTANA